MKSVPAQGLTPLALMQSAPAGVPASAGLPTSPDQKARQCAANEVLINKYCSNATVISPQSTGNDRKDIQDAIEKAKTVSGPVVIALDPRTYRLECENKDNDACLALTGSNNLKLLGVRGATKLLVASPASGAIMIWQSAQITVEGLSIDYETPPFSQGTILSVQLDPGQNFSTITYGVDAKFPEMNDAKLFSSCGANTLCLYPPGEVFKTAGNSAARWIYDYVSPVHEPGAIVNIGPRVWRVKAYGDVTSFTQVGDKIAFTPMRSHGVFAAHSYALNFYGVDVRAAPGAAYVLNDISGAIDMDTVNVVPEPGSGRVLSTNFDAYHIMNSRAAVTLHDSIASQNGDDYLNILTVAWKVSSVSADGLELDPDGTQPNGSIQQGDFIQVTDPSMNTLRLTGGSATVTGVQSAAGKTYVSLNAPTTGVVVGDLFYNISTSSPYSVIRNNTFCSHRGAIRMRSAGGSFLNNTFLDPWAAILLYSVDNVWNEGPMLPPPWISGTTVSNGYLRVFGPQWRFDGNY